MLRAPIVSGPEVTSDHVLLLAILCKYTRSAHSWNKTVQSQSSVSYLDMHQ